MADIRKSTRYSQIQIKSYQDKIQKIETNLNSDIKPLKLEKDAFTKIKTYFEEKNTNLKNNTIKLKYRKGYFLCYQVLNPGHRNQIIPIT